MYLRLKGGNYFYAVGLIQSQNYDENSKLSYPISKLFCRLFNVCSTGISFLWFVVHSQFLLGLWRWFYDSDTLNRWLSYIQPQSGIFIHHIFLLYSLDLYSTLSLTHLGLTPFCRSPPEPIIETEGFATHICVTREMRAVFHDVYMRHQAKMS